MNQSAHCAERREWVYNRRYEPSKEYGWDIPADMIEASDGSCFVHERCPATLMYDGASQAEIHVDAIIVATHGVCSQTGPHREAACGVYFGDRHHLNKGFRVTSGVDRGQCVSELLAALEALRICADFASNGLEHGQPRSEPEADSDIKVGIKGEANTSKKRVRAEMDDEDSKVAGPTEAKRVKLDESENKIKVEEDHTDSTTPHNGTQGSPKKENQSPPHRPRAVIKTEPLDRDDCEGRTPLVDVPEDGDPVAPVPASSLGLNRIIVKTDSEYLVHRMTRYMFEDQMGRRNADGRPSRRDELLRELEQQTTALNAFGIEVLFWLVQPGENRLAAALAEQVLSEAGFAK